MNINSILSLFTLFSGEIDANKFYPLISSAITEVKSRLKPDTDLNDERLSFLCAAIANLNHTRILASQNQLRYTFAGTVTQSGDISQQVRFAQALVDEYSKSARDLLIDSNFTFVSV